MFWSARVEHRSLWPFCNDGWQLQVLMEQTIVFSCCSARGLSARRFGKAAGLFRQRFRRSGGRAWPRGRGRRSLPPHAGTNRSAPPTLHNQGGTSTPGLHGTLRKRGPRNTQQKRGSREVSETLGTPVNLRLVEIYRCVPPACSSDARTTELLPIPTGAGVQFQSAARWGEKEKAPPGHGYRIQGAVCSPSTCSSERERKVSVGLPRRLNRIDGSKMNIAVYNDSL